MSDSETKLPVHPEETKGGDDDASVDGVRSAAPAVGHAEPKEATVTPRAKRATDETRASRGAGTGPKSIGEAICRIVVVGLVVPAGVVVVAWLFLWRPTGVLLCDVPGRLHGQLFDHGG